MKNMRSFTVTHVPWTNTKPSRVKIYDNRNKKYVYASYTHTKYERQEDVAHEYLLARGINCTILSEGKKGFLLLTDNLETQI